MNMDGMILASGGMSVTVSNTVLSNSDCISRSIESSHCLEKSPSSALFADFGVIVGIESSEKLCSLCSSVKADVTRI